MAQISLEIIRVSGSLLRGNLHAFCIVPKVYPLALDLDKARRFATQFDVVTTFRDHDGARSLASPYFYRYPADMASW